MAEWFTWIPWILKENAFAEWLVWIFRIWVVIGIWLMASRLKRILECVKDITNKMDKSDGRRDALPSIDSFLSSIGSGGKHTVPDDSGEEL